MRITLGGKKSAGVAVTRPTHRHIMAGNAARSRRDWAASAAAYDAALKEAPGLAHIWVQFGHALKETGAAEKALRAYQRAVELRPADSDALLHLGHGFKMCGDMVNAARIYAQAVQADPTNLDAVTELHRIVAGSAGPARDVMVGLLKAVVLTQPEAEPDTAAVRAAQALEAVLSQGLALGRPTAHDALQGALAALGELQSGSCAASPGPAASAVAFDISDLIGFFGHTRLPTGIQRMQIEVIANRIAASGGTIRICCYNDEREGWLDIPPAQFGSLAQLSLASGDRNAPEWIQALTRLHLHFALSEPLEFPPGSCIVTLGASWGHPNFFLSLRRHRSTSGLRYIPFVHDFVPIVMPQYHVRQLTEDFVAWVIGAFPHADAYLVNSEATKRDLLRVAGMLGTPVAPADVAVVPLDADFRKPGTAPRGPASPAPGGQAGLGPFVLMVATLEPRKGHLVALHAWQQLIRRRGRRSVPRLVCVGGKGWMNEAVHELLARDKVLAERVTLLSNLSDTALAELYQACQFTIYPSLYEGWGLPITESLCYGKPVIASDVSSLPEAGGAFAVYFKAGSADGLADAAERMSFDAAYREAAGARIANGFRPRTWRDVAVQIETEITRLAVRDRPTPASLPAQLGAYYPVARTEHTRIWRGLGSGEIVRAGSGWLWPEAWGCWTRLGGGDLDLPLPPSRGPLQVALSLRNLPDCTTAWTVRASGVADLAGTLLPGERRWVRFQVDASPSSRTLRVRLAGDEARLVPVKSGSARRDGMASVGLEGFHVHAVADDRAGTAFLEAVAFGELDELDAYREPSGAPAAGDRSAA